MKTLQVFIPAVLLFATWQAKAQTDPLWTLFNQNRLFHNAALAGIEKEKIISFTYRNQWPQLQSGMRTSQLAFEKPWKTPKASGGMGAYVLHDASFASSTFRLGIMGNYCFMLAEKTKIRLGLNGYYHTLYLDISKLKFGGPPPAVNKNPVGSYAVFPGISFEHKDLLIGASVNYFRQRSVFSDYTTWYSTWYGYAAWMKHLPGNLAYKPALILRYLKPFDAVIDINNTFICNERVEIGLTYRGFGTNTNPVCFNFGLYMLQQRLRLVYAYDKPNKSIPWKASANEVQLSFRF